MKRAIVYYDGFNLYHAIDDLNAPSLKWVNLWDLSASFLRGNETLVGVKYFSAYATWRPDAYARHRHYVRALKAVGVQPILGQFKKRYPNCKSCGSSYTTHEEKESDVNVAIHLVSDALTDQFDRAIVVSADTDLRSAVHMAREMTDNKLIDVVAPPLRGGHARSLKPLFEITKGRLRKNLFGAQVFDANGDVVATRPGNYD